MPLNTWTHRLNLADVFNDENRTFEQRRDEIARRIKAAPFYNTSNYELVDIVEELGDSLDVDEFDGAWDRFYDYADTHRIWVATI